MRINYEDAKTILSAAFGDEVMVTAVANPPGTSRHTLNRIQMKISYASGSLELEKGRKARPGYIFFGVEMRNYKIFQYQEDRGEYVITIINPNERIIIEGNITPDIADVVSELGL